MPRNGIASHFKSIFSNHAATKTCRGVTTVRSFATSKPTSTPRSAPASASPSKPTKPSSSSRPKSKPNQEGTEQQQAQPPVTTKQQQKRRQHSDLESFLSDAKRRGLDEKSTLFTGTRYEYLVAARLARYGFALTRVGGASDFGIDLIGDWTIPSSTPSSPSSSSSSPARTIKVLIQCKGGENQRIGPHLIRELEGSFAGAPPGWRGGRVLGLLVGEKAATRGVREALGRADVAMGYVWCEGGGGTGGLVRQMLWNQRADEVVLVRNGEPVPFV